MSRAAWLNGTLAAVAAGGAGFWLGHDSAGSAIGQRARTEFAQWLPPTHVANPLPAPGTGPVIYYRDPGGKPLYSSEPRRTPDGREYVAVRASEDVTFDAASEDNAKVEAAPSSVAGGKRVRFYRNPMGLPDTSPVPKKDSMGMDYIPVYEGEETDGKFVKVSPGRLQRTGVRSEVVEQRVVSRPVRVPGTIQLDERRVTVVATRSEAFVDKVENVTTGDRVRKGQPLVEVYSAEINAAAAQLIANPGFDGSRRRLQNLNVPAEVIAEMERTRKVPMAITWSSPRDGVILERAAVEGMRSAAGDTLFRIGDVSVMWVLADVPETQLGSIRVGQQAKVAVRSLPGRTFVGKVALVYPQVNRENRTTRVRIELPNPDGVLLPDMYADVEIATGSEAPVVAVPNDAVIDNGTRQIVLVDAGEGRFEPRPIETGARGGGFVQVEKGLAAGERVVTGANFLIDAESNLQSALQGMAAANGSPGQEAKP